MENLDFDGAYKIWLDALDASYQRLRAIHADPKHLNQRSNECNRTVEEFNWVQSQIFQFKNLWALVFHQSREQGNKPTDM